MNVAQTFSSQAPRVRNRIKSDAGVRYDVRAVPLDTLVDSAASSSEAIDDMVVTRHTTATVDRTGRVVVVGIAEAPTLESLTPAIATVNADGFVTRVSDGLARIRVTLGNFQGEVLVNCRRVAPTTSDVFSAWAEDSLGESLAAAIDTRLEGESAATALPIFTTQNHGAQTYVRNTACWAADLAAKLTCCSPWNSRGGTTRAGTAITAQHILNAAHYELALGDTVRFVTAGNAVVDRTITGKARHPSYQPYYPDLTVYTLNEALPETITPCKVLPANWGDYLIRVLEGRPPALCLDQEEKALVADVFSLSGNYASFSTPTDAQRLAFYENKIAGDSGNPAFFIIDGELALLTVWTYGGAGSGTFITPQISAINAMIATADAQAGVSTGLEVSPADLSAFTDFSS